MGIIFQAHDGYDQSNDPRALNSLQYMILCKVLNDTAHEVPAFLSSKIGLKHSGIAVEAMEAVSKAAMEKSLEKFQATVSWLVLLWICIVALIPCHIVGLG